MPCAVLVREVGSSLSWLRQPHCNKRRWRIEVSFKFSPFNIFDKLLPLHQLNSSINCEVHPQPHLQFAQRDLIKKRGNQLTTAPPSVPRGPAMLPAAAPPPAATTLTNIVLQRGVSPQLVFGFTFETNGAVSLPAIALVVPIATPCPKKIEKGLYNHFIRILLVRFMYLACQCFSNSGSSS